MKRLLLAALLFTGCASQQGSLPSLIEDLGTNKAVPAFSHLDQSSDPAVFNALLEGTRNTKARVRAQCARLLGRKKDVTAIASLRAMLADSDRPSRVQAAHALAVLADPAQMLEWLQEAQTTPPVREALAMALVDEQIEEVLPLLRSWLVDPNQPLKLRLIACRGLHQAGPRAQAGALLLAQVKEPSNDLELRARALEAYGSVSGPAAIGELSSWLKGHPLKMQEGALQGLGHVHAPAALALLAGAAQDRSLATSSRQAAVRGIGESKESPQARALLFEALKDPDPMIRKAAAGSLNCFVGQPGVKDALLEARHNETVESVELEVECVLKAVERHESCPPCTPCP